MVFDSEVDGRYGAALIALASVCVMGLVYHQTIIQMANVWMDSVTFRHGFVIIPISAWLIGCRRASIIKSAARPSWWALPLLLILTVVWWIGRLTDVKVVQELAMVAMVPAFVVLTLGLEIFKSLRFPLLYLFFAVPVGWFLVPPLMHVTAAMAVQGLKWTGVPVYQDGFRISMPTGDFLVATSCSGIRYLIACLALGTLFAYLFYRSWWRRVLFMAIAMIVPIVANGIRAYGIVLLAYLSDMRIATGFDHVIYGFIFFAFVLFLMFWLGAWFREDLEPGRDEDFAMSVRPARAPAGLAHVGLAAALGVALVALGPVSWAAVQRLDSVATASHGGALVVGSGPWTGPMKVSGSWHPKFLGDHKVLAGRYQSGADSVEVFVEAYPYPHQGTAVASSLNGVVDNPHQLIDTRDHQLSMVGSLAKPMAVTQSVIQDQHTLRLVWSWYRVAGHSTANRLLEKVWEALSVLRGGQGWAQWVSVSTPITADAAGAQTVLKSFLHDNYQSLITCLSPDAIATHACSR